MCLHYTVLMSRFVGLTSLVFKRCAEPQFEKASCYHFSVFYFTYNEVCNVTGGNRIDSDVWFI